jgi:hypothetical protein
VGGNFFHLSRQLGAQLEYFPLCVAEIAFFCLKIFAIRLNLSAPAELSHRADARPTPLGAATSTA